MNKLYIDNWFKLPPEEKLKGKYIIMPAQRNAGRRAKNAKSRKKIKK